MGYEKILSAEADTTINLGGRDKSGKERPSVFEGYYLTTKTGLPNKFNPSKPDCLHIFQTAKGNVGVWGKSHLNPQIAKATPGTMVRITYVGTRPSSKGNDQLLFEVAQDKSKTIDISGLAPSGYEDPIEAFESFESSEVEENDYVPPAPSTPPARAAKPTDAARAAKVQALLAGSRNRS